MYLVVLNYENGICIIRDAKDINVDNQKDFNWEEWINKEYTNNNISWMLANEINQ